MNIISANCVAGQIYKRINLQYNNPFMWVSIFLSDYMYIIENWDNINLSIIGYGQRTQFGRLDCCYITIPNDINIYFTHHIQNDKCKEPYYEYNSLYTNMHYNNMLNYLITKWNNRYNIMLNKKENPIFIYDEQPIYTNIDIMNFINCNTPYKRVLYTFNKDLLKYNNENLKIYFKEYNIPTCEIAKHFCKNYLNI